MNKKITKIKLHTGGLAWQISAKLTQAIIRGAFTGGEQLTEFELQRKFGVSRSPIREALRDLEKKDLVEIIPRRGAFVKKVTNNDIKETFPVRALLEGFAAQEACRHLTKEDYAQLEKALQDMEVAAAKKNAKLYMKYNEKFHTIYIHASKNTVLIKILENLLLQSKWFLSPVLFVDHLKQVNEDLELSIGLHEEIFKLFKKRDEKSRGESKRAH